MGLIGGKIIRTDATKCHFILKYESDDYIDAAKLYPNHIENVYIYIDVCVWVYVKCHSAEKDSRFGVLWHPLATICLTVSSGCRETYN